MCLCIYNIVNIKVIDEEILMYEEENTKIESQINVTVEKYLEYESNTFIELKDSDGINLISLYPELKSDVLISKQIDVYINNNNQIKNLKNNKIKNRVYKWWLYFGK